MQSGCANSNHELALDHDYFMGLALIEAQKAQARLEVPVGAVLVDSVGKVLAEAHNAPIGLLDPTAHAEILALRHACRALQNYRLPGAILYVTLEPCAMCLGAMLQARVDTLVFGAIDAKSGTAGTVMDLTNVPSFNHYIKVISGVRAEECALLLRRFFQERRQEEKNLRKGEVPKWP
ncbi:MAG: tRNA adenosine(34) deaminase TadA [Desulforhabdus sp.]|nr:tRNA adenosine(34) deaminase TadA [Desulforhabdus sp.]